MRGMKCQTADKKAQRKKESEEAAKQRQSGQRTRATAKENEKF